MSRPRLDAVVVGAGVAGLAAGLELARAGLSIRVMDAAEHPGGVLQSERIGGYLLERGPSTIRPTAPMVAFLDRVGLEGRLVRASPASRLRYLLHQGRLVPAPLTPLGFARTPLLTARGKLRLLAEPFVRRGNPTGETVSEFASRRLGREVLERLVGPFLTGVYAGDESRLGVESVFPTLVSAERAHGSISRGLLAGALRRSEARAPGGSWSTVDGMAGLAASLAERLGEALRLGTRVAQIGPDGVAWRVETSSASGDESWSALGLVIATPSRDAADLLRGFDSEVAKNLAGIDYAPIVSVSLGVDPARVRTPIEGFGFLVAREERESLLGCLFPSRLFPQRAPLGRELLTALLGGAGRPEAVERSDADLVRDVRDELDRVLGLVDPPEILAITRWPRAVPQPGREHPRLVASLRERFARRPALVLAGGYLDGVSVADALVSGVRAAHGLTKVLASGE